MRTRHSKNDSFAESSSSASMTHKHALSLQEQTAPKRRKAIASDVPEPEISFLLLPMDIHLHIIALLDDVCDLLRLTSVSRYSVKHLRASLPVNIAPVLVLSVSL